MRFTELQRGEADVYKIRFSSDALRESEQVVLPCIKMSYTFEV